MKELKVLELFAGIGACSKALERLNIPHEIVDAVEIDKYAIKSFNAIHGTNFEPQDITTWDKDVDVDLIMHGSPCQDFSLAGKQAGGDKDSGTRSSLMYETIRIVEKLKPKYVVWENVKNLLSKKHRHNFDAYLKTMENLGYNNYYQVLNAKDYGIPQNRERVFTISILGNENYEFPKGEECNNIIKVVGNYMPSGHDASRIVDENGLAPTVKENHGTVTAVAINFEFPPKQPLKLRLKDLLDDEVDEKYYLSKKMIDYISANNEKYSGNNDKSLINKSIASAVNTGEGQRRCDASNYISKQFDENFDLKIMRDFGIYGDRQDGSVFNPNGLSPTLTTKSSLNWNVLINEEIKNKSLRETLEQNNIEKDISFIDSYNRNIRKDDLSGTITTRVNDSNNTFIAIKNATKKGYLEAHDGDGCYITNIDKKRGTVQKEMIPTLKTSPDIGCVVNNLRIRKLTPKETWRLMGFDDKDFEKTEKTNSNTQLYKQAGNSIVVNVLEAIFKELFKEYIPNLDKWSDLD